MVPTPPAPQPKQKLSTSQVLKQRQAINSGQPVPGAQPVKPEDKPDTPEYKKKQAMIKGPILELARENQTAYGMSECTFTGLKDIFLAVLESNSRTGVLSPQRFLEVFKRDNEMFQNSNHQDAHEFYGLVLNGVVANVEANARRLQEQAMTNEANGLSESVEAAMGAGIVNHSGYQSPGTGWVHDIFEGLLTSEVKCLTCEKASQKEEVFLDLSIELQEHTSVTSCLRKFSAEEMMCEQNKFQCDNCGGLQEAERRMKVKRLPKVLTLHLKRFKWTEDYSRLQKLFHRVVYPYYLRLFDTSDETEDPDRLYELYAVVVHVGGNAYHGHYVSIIKTKDWGWILFDDEMVEPVDKHFVRNFFGDKPGMATAYVLFYQETTFEKMRAEQEADGMEEVHLAKQAANMAQEGDFDKNDTAPLSRQTSQPTPPTPVTESLAKLAHARTAPDFNPTTPPPEAQAAASLAPSVPAVPVPVAAATTAATSAPLTPTKTKDDLKREKKEREAVEKANKQKEKLEEKEKQKRLAEEEKRRREAQIRAIQQRREEQEQLAKALDESKKTAAQEGESHKTEGHPGAFGFLDRSKRGSKSGTKKFGFFGKDKHNGDEASEPLTNGDTPEKQEKKSRLSMGLGRKKSSNVLS